MFPPAQKTDMAAGQGTRFECALVYKGVLKEMETWTHYVSHGENVKGKGPLSIFGAMMKNT